MPVVGWILVGSLIGCACVSWSQRVVVEMTSDSARYKALTRWWLVAGSAFGGASGWFVAGIEPVAQFVVVTTVAILTAVQAPIDLQTHRLSRPPTIVATVVISTSVAANTLVAGSPRALLETFAAAFFVTGVYVMAHRVSPRSLGWGDVLIVFPLALALGFVALDQTVVWQLLAAVSGAVHAVVIRLIRRAPNVPFGPHLLMAAWAVLITSV